MAAQKIGPQVKVTLPADVIKWLEGLAGEEKRSLSAEIRRAVEYARRHGFGQRDGSAHLGTPGPLSEREIEYGRELGARLKLTRR